MGSNYKTKNIYSVKNSFHSTDFTALLGDKKGIQPFHNLFTKFPKVYCRDAQYWQLDRHMLYWLLNLTGFTHLQNDP